MLRSPTVRCEPMESIREVARRMTEAGASSAIVDLRGGGFGIVTDRDIRTKIVAAGLPLSAPVSTVMTMPVFTVTPDRLGGEVLFELLERGIRHAPIVSEGGQLVGVIEDADLFPAQSRSWFGARRVDLARLVAGGSRRGGARGCRRLWPTCTRRACARPRWSRVVSALVDALTTRALELVDACAGGEGVVWVAVGARRDGS